MSRQKPLKNIQELAGGGWPFSAAVSLVSRLVVPGKDGGERTSDIYGLKCSASFARLDLAGSWRKTCGGFSQLTLDGHSEEYCQTWPKMGIVWDGYAMALQMSAHRTDGKGYLLWATPAAADCQGSHGGGQGRSLRTDIHNLKRGMWPTPHSTCSTGPGKQGRQGGENLQTSAQGQLNPAWVTLLMGFPPGWLDIDGPPDQALNTPGNRPA